MPIQTIFNLHLALGYVVWLLCFGTFILPWLRKLAAADAHRVIATLHSFRFFGLVFIVPGVVGPNLPTGFANFAAYGDLATGILAILAMSAFRIRPLFWTFVVAFNVVGIVDLLMDYYHAVRLNLPAVAGQLGATYAIAIIYVPILFITHVLALVWLVKVVGHPRADAPVLGAVQ